MKNKFQEKLEQNIIFVQSYTPYDFTEFMGQYAVRIDYTNGNMDMLTTKSTNPNVFGSSDFDSTEEYFEFIEWLNSNNIKKDPTKC